MITSNNLQLQYLWDFNKCFQAILSQLRFENFWLYLLGAGLFWLKIIKSHYKSPLKVCKLKFWVKLPPDVFKMSRKFSKGSLISISSDLSKNHLLIKVLYRPIWFNLCRGYFLFHSLNVSLCYYQQGNFIMS